MEKSIKNKEIDLKTKEGELQKAEEKLMEVKTNEAYKAAQKELDSQRKMLSSLEDQILNDF